MSCVLTVMGWGVGGPLPGGGLQHSVEEGGTRRLPREEEEDEDEEEEDQRSLSAAAASACAHPTRRGPDQERRVCV